MTSNLQELPLFPLNTVVFPEGILPLRIFEPRYLDMVKNCMRNSHGFGVVLLKKGKESGVAVDIFNTGTLCVISDWQSLPDGFLGITAKAEKKICVSSTHIESNNLLVGMVELLEQDPDLILPDEFNYMSDILKRIIKEVGEPYNSIPTHYDKAGWVGSRLAELLPLQLYAKQRLLEIDDHIVRLYHLKEAMQEAKFL